MKVPRLQMESQFGRIQIEQTPSQLKIRQAKAVQTIEQPKAEMNIRSTNGKVKIDQSQAWEERQLMSTIRLNEIHAQAGMRAAQEGVARRAEQGAELIQIEKDRNIVADQARTNGHRQMKTLGVKYIPSPFSVKINYEPGNLEINVQPQKPKIDVLLGKVEVDYVPGSVDVSMEAYPDLSISVIDLYT